MPDALSPLSYHLSVATQLEALEPRGWAVFRRAARSPAPEPDQRPDNGDAAVEGKASDVAVPDDDLEQQLLRHAYRMEAASHPQVHAAASRAAAALEIGVPVVVYQLESMERANAALVFRPHEAVIALSGNVLALLSHDELVACFGHELAHHRLWTSDDGRVLVADRFLDALSIDAGSPPYYLETARRFDLATEMYADRGSLLAAGDLEVTIAALVKIATGLTDVDPQAFLRQAEDARPDRGADGLSHPETVLRAWALARYNEGEGDRAADTLLAPSLDIDRLDLMDRKQMEALTRRLVLDVIAVDWLRTDPVASHARQFMIDVAATPSADRGWRGVAKHIESAMPAPPVEARIPEGAQAETRRFLSYVLLDLATVDPDLDDEGLVETLAVAREAGIASAFEEVARRELSINARTWEAIRRRSAERRASSCP